VLPTELDTGKGTDAATDQVDEQCRAATNQQLSHPRSQAAAAVVDALVIGPRRPEKIGRLLRERLMRRRVGAS
jgi:hypothetical protein